MVLDALQLVTAAISGGVFVEIIRRVIPTRDKQMELRDKRETETIAEAERLRAILWDEVTRLSEKVKSLETRLDQANQLIFTLRAENIILKSEVDILKQKSEKENC